MKDQVLFSLRNNEEIFMNVVCCSCHTQIGALRIKLFLFFSTHLGLNSKVDKLFLSFNPLLSLKQGNDIFHVLSKSTKDH